MMPMAKPTRLVAAVAATFRPALLALFALFVSGFLWPAVAAEPCCQITSIDTSGGTVTAKESASQRTFQFTVKDRLLLSRLKVGQRIYANFNSKQVSVDGRVFCCPIVTISAAAPQPAPRPTTAPSTPSASPPRPAPGGPPPAGQPATGAAPPVITLPKAFIATGPVRRSAPQRSAQWESRRLSTTVDGKPTDVEVIHLRGIEGIEAADIPESAKAFFLTHAKTLPPDEVAHYVVNKKQIEEWAKTHPMPETLKKKKETHRKRGCHSISMKCARKGVEHVSKEVSKQAEALRKEARDEWKDISRELGRGLKMTEGALLECFRDHTISSGPIRIGSLTIPPKIRFAGPLATGKDGKVDGRANISFPIRLDEVTVEVKAFVIPCAVTVPALPIFVRPKSVSLEGVLTVDSTLDLELNAKGRLTKEIPLIQRTEVNLFTTVIFIHAVPVELDLGIEFEGQVVIKTDGALHATFCDVRKRKIRLDFDCNGKGCSGSPRDLPVDFTPIRDLQVAAQGHASIRPAVFTAVSLDVNFGALGARVGPEFYVSAEVQGAARAGSSGTPPASPAVTAAGLTANLYAGVDMRYLVDFLQPEFAPGVSPVKSLESRAHLWKDSLLSKSVGSPSAAAQPSKPGSASARCAK